MKYWPARQARARFSELLREALEQPQGITVHGEPTVVLISDSEYRRLCVESQQSKRSFAEWWKSAPCVPEFDLPPRD